MSLFSLKQNIETHQDRDVHSAFVRRVVRLDGHDPDPDGVLGSVARPVGLDEGGDAPEVEVDGGGVGENELVPLVAAHRQGYWGIRGYGASGNLEHLKTAYYIT